MRGPNGDKGPQHPGLREWWRWREGLPLMFGSMAEMPIEVADAFEYLVRTYGKDSLNIVASQHEAALAGMTNPEIAS